MKKIFFSFVYICSLLLFCYGFSNIVTTFAIDENNDKILIHFDNLNLYNAVSNSLAN